LRQPDTLAVLKFTVMQASKNKVQEVAACITDTRTSPVLTLVNAENYFPSTTSVHPNI
jgi:hypothetical protein